jgi:hypothetical protein
MNNLSASTEGYEPFAAFLATILKSERAEPELIAQAFATHLAQIDSAKLPKAAQPVWQTLVTKLLKTQADKVPLPPRAIAGIGSWPMARIGELIAAVRHIEAEIAREANDRLADETNQRVSRAYL